MTVVDWGLLEGIPFFKMTGSGNDFVIVDGRTAGAHLLKLPEVIRSICNRHNGVGADGIVIVSPMASGDVQIDFFNSDGSIAELCGNATLCATALIRRLAMTLGTEFRLRTVAGTIAARVEQERPEIQVAGIASIRLDQPGIPAGAGERRVGFAMVGVPHLVILCDDADAIPIEARGPVLRSHPALGSAGANVNWISPTPSGAWRYRTWERGVEGETLACGTGAVASATLLVQWGLVPPGTSVRLITTSGLPLSVRPAADVGGPTATATLGGEGRMVFRGVLQDLTPQGHDATQP